MRAWILSSSPRSICSSAIPRCCHSPMARLLRSWIESQSGRKSVWVEVFARHLGRLADPELAGDITKLLEDRANSVDVRSELLQIIRFGRLTECLPLLIQILADTEEPDRLKPYVMAAIRDMGTEESRRDASSASLLLHTAIRPSLFGLLRGAFFPGHLCGTTCPTLGENRATGRQFPQSLMDSRAAHR